MDEALGAFVRLMQAAPPLRRQSPTAQSPGVPGSGASSGSREMSVAAGIEQLARVKARLQALTVLPQP